MNKFPRTPEQAAEERAIHERSRRERPSRAEMIASGDIDPGRSGTIEDAVRRLRGDGDDTQAAPSPLTPEHAADLARLQEAMDGPIDTSDIPEATGPGRRVKRDAEGRIVRDKGADANGGEEVAQP